MIDLYEKQSCCYLNTESGCDIALRKFQRRVFMTTILGFDKTHIEQARELTLANYNEERSIVMALPQIDAIPVEEFDDLIMNLAWLCLTAKKC